MYGNRDEKVHKTEHFGAKENMKTKTEPSPIDRDKAADRSAGVAKTRNKKAENLPIDRGLSADRSAEVEIKVAKSQRACRSIALN